MQTCPKCGDEMVSCTDEYGQIETLCCNPACEDDMVDPDMEEPGAPKWVEVEKAQLGGRGGQEQ